MDRGAIEVEGHVTPIESEAPPAPERTVRSSGKVGLWRVCGRFPMREVIFRRLLRRSSVVHAALVSSLLFGFMHEDLFGAAFDGLVLVALYASTRSLWCCVLSHALHNSMVAVLHWYRPGLEFYMLADLRVWVVLAAICLPCLVLYIRRALRDLKGFAV